VLPSGFRVADLPPLNQLSGPERLKLLSIQRKKPERRTQEEKDLWKHYEPQISARRKKAHGTST
jgi:hypothetical protein